jgi:hypothetical protein
MHASEQSTRSDSNGGHADPHAMRDAIPKPPLFRARSSDVTRVVRVESRFRGNAKSAGNAGSSENRHGGPGSPPEFSPIPADATSRDRANGDRRSATSGDEIRADSHRYARIARSKPAEPSTTRIPFADWIRAADESAILKKSRQGQRPVGTTTE